MRGTLLAGALAIVSVLTTLGVAKEKEKDRTVNGDWAPKDIDQAVPRADLSHPCPLPALLDETSRQVRKLVENLQQFSAHEKLEYGEVDDAGRPQSARSVMFTYVANIREVWPGQFTVEEYRNDSLSLHSFPSHLATTGTAAFALIFHPYYIGDFDVSCEGLTKIDGRPAWQVHFAQRSDRNNNFRGYRVDTAFYPIQLKGRAWISPDSHEILRLETDLLHPVPRIRLRREHVVVEYGPVRFPHHDLSLWLPKNATIYMDYRRHRYFHNHSFTDYQLFWVDTAQDDGKLLCGR